MRIAVLCQYFSPEPMTKINTLVRSLVEAGHSVQVLTGIPNRPYGHYYEGYTARLLFEEEKFGARVIRTYTWPYRGDVIWRRIMNYGSFMLSSLLGIARLAPFDILYAYHPPLTIAFPAYLASVTRRVPFIYDVQDIWPEAGVAAGALQEGWLYRFMSALAKWVYAQASHITVIAPDFKDILVDQGVSPDKISVVSNWADDSIYIPRSANGVRQQYGLPEGRFLAMYAGNMGMTHGVEYLLDAARLLKERSDITFVFAGTGAEYDKMLQKKQQEGLDNVHFLGYIPPPRMPELLAAADLMLIHLRKSDSGAVSLPSRMLAYMACGRPMLVASEGAPRRFVERIRAGIGCDPENPVVIAERIKNISSQPEQLTKMGNNGRAIYEKEFCEQITIKNVIALIEQVAHDHTRI
jgi:colanic acid biosynthesis glycosyl transferase WcaI